MYRSSSIRENLRPWAPTGFAGSVATAAVAFLTAQVLTAPVYPESGIPAGGAPTVFRTEPAATAPPCFLGRHDWPDGLVGPQPVCPR